jgi:hypothetical protein
LGDSKPKTNNKTIGSVAVHRSMQLSINIKPIMGVFDLITPHRFAQGGGDQGDRMSL